MQLFAASRRHGLWACGAVGAGLGVSRRTGGDPPMPSSRMAFRSAVAVVPHPDKAHRRYELPPKCGGEDAYFIDDDAGVLGVADGVGGWAAHGIDPGLYSRELMCFAAAAARAGERDPLVLLDRAHKQATAPGSSTALLVALSPAQADGSTATLHAANLGDSGFLLMRRGEVLLQSPAQQHSFNFPFQLGATSTGAGSSKPTDAQIFSVEDVRPGDVVVLGTDGLFDNVFPSEIVAALACAGLSLAEAPLPAVAKTIAQCAADAIAVEAKRASTSTVRQSPFALEAAKAGFRFQGGKLDDITVVVSIVVSTAADGDRDTAPPTSRL